MYLKPFLGGQETTLRIQKKKKEKKYVFCALITTCAIVQGKMRPENGHFDT